MTEQTKELLSPVMIKDLADAELNQWLFDISQALRERYNTTERRIDFETGTFYANGKLYTIESVLTIERYAEFQILEKQLAYGFTVQAFFDKIRTLWDNQNKMKFAENAVILNDLMRGVSKLSEREPIVLKVCSLFINTPDEDRKTINDDMISAKINDWEKEGIAMQDFFEVATTSVSGLLELYKNISQLTLLMGNLTSRKENEESQ